MPRLVIAGETPSTRHMMAIPCMAWLALTNANAATASHRSPKRTRSRLSAGPRSLHRAAGSAAQPIEFLPFGRGQTIAAQTLIEFCLPDPLADRLDRGLEFARQCRDAAAAVRQLDDSTPVFRCVCRCVRGIWKTPSSYFPTPITKSGQLQWSRHACLVVAALRSAATRGAASNCDETD